MKQDAEDLVLGRVLRGYCRWQRPYELVTSLAGECGCLSPDAQSLFLSSCYNHYLCREHKPPAEYRRRVLKAIVQAAEREFCEISEKLTEALSDTFLETPYEMGSWGYKTIFYQPRRSERSHIRDHFTLRLSSNMLEGSTGCYQWEAGLMLGQYILSNCHIVRGKSCVELGCGSGLVGLCLDRAGASSIILTDGSSEALENCRHNLKINQCTSKRVEVKGLKWGGSYAELEGDLILGADLLYDPENHPGLVETLKALLGGERVAYLGTCKRNPSTLLDFLDMAEKGGLQIEEIDCQWSSSSVEILDFTCTTDVLLYCITALS